MAIDVVFNDGTRLRDMNAVDQFGIGLHPKDQGDGEFLKPGQWNYVGTDLGKIAAGKVIREIVLGFEIEDATPGQAIEGSFDNIMVFRGDGNFEDVKAIAALYDAEGKLINAIVSDSLKLRAFETVALNRAIVIDASTAGAQCYSKIYIWTADDYIPVTDPVRYQIK